jgi:hypothetical protein
MANKNTGVERKGRRGMPKTRKHEVRSRTLTLGDLVAAAMDATGGDVKQAGALLSSREMSRALGRRIVLE